MFPCPNIQAIAIDAFNHSWDNWDFFYLNPPYPLISMALAKLRQSFFANAIFVCPDLEGRPWFPSLLLSIHISFRLSLFLQQVVGGTAGANLSGRVQFIRDHISSRFPDEPVIVDLMTLPICPLSAREYQRKWTELLASVRREGIDFGFKMHASARGEVSHSAIY